MKVAFPLPSEDAYRRKNLLEEVAKKQKLMIEADGGIHFIPLNNIKYMSVYPASEHLDPGVIKGARFMDWQPVEEQTPRPRNRRRAALRNAALRGCSLMPADGWINHPHRVFRAAS